MSDSFTKIIRKAGLTNDRHVLYSTKDTLVDRLEGFRGQREHSNAPSSVMRQGVAR